MNKFQILVVDDDEDDQLLIKDAFQETDFAGGFQFINNGLELMAHLQPFCIASKTVGKLPDLILLDLNMPKMTGQDVLSAIKSDSFLKLIPVVVFSTSSHQANIRHCYDLGANSYIVKPLTYGQLLKTAKSIQAYWFQIACIA